MADRDRIDPERDRAHAGVRPEVSDRRLARLSELDDYEVADGEPDIRGWDVKGAGGRKLGTVHDLVVDRVALEVMYLDVELDREIIGGGHTDRHILMPLGSAQLDDDDNVVRVPREPSGGFSAAPAYQHTPLTVDDERRLRDFYGEAGAHHETSARFYGKRRAGREDQPQIITRSEEQVAVGRRPVMEGEVVIRKHVDTEHVRQQVPVAREEVTVERRPPRPGASANPEIRDEEIRVPVMGEELVVEKRAVPKEEIVIKRHARRDEKTVEADLKRERVDVERTDDRKKREQ